MPSFAQDIRPNFRDIDVQSMSWMFKLSDYSDVREHADAIYRRLSQGTMPCDGPWPPDRVQLFRAWMDEGYPE